MEGFGAFLRSIFFRSDAANTGVRLEQPTRSSSAADSHLEEQGSLIDCRLPEELLVEVFKYLSPADIVRGPALVCRRWQRISLQQVVWSSRISLPGPLTAIPGCEEGWPLPKLWSALQADLLTGVKQHKRNRGLFGFLLPEGTGQWQTGRGSDWALERDCGGGMVPEYCPTELSPRDEVIASSHMLCSAFQVIDLQACFLRAGLGAASCAAVLEMRPALQFFIWFGQRSDCGATGAVTLKFGRMPEEALKPALPAHVHPWPGLPQQILQHRDEAAEERWMNERVAHVVLQGQHGMWKGCAVTIEAIPLGSRFITIALEGRDTQFWAGHYGMKFSKPCLKFMPSTSSGDMITCSKPCFQAVFGQDGVRSRWSQ